VKYNKLVRDKVPEIIHAKGELVTFHLAESAEYWQKLKEKLTEEVTEFQKEESVEELADILEVIDAIIQYAGIRKDELDKAKEQKAAKKGKFERRIILDNA